MYYLPSVEMLFLNNFSESFRRAKSPPTNSTISLIWCWTSNIGCVWWPVPNNTVVYWRSLHLWSKYDLPFNVMLLQNRLQMVQDRRIHKQTLELVVSSPSTLAPATGNKSDEKIISRWCKGIRKEKVLELRIRKYWAVSRILAIGNDHDRHLVSCRVIVEP